MTSTRDNQQQSSNGFAIQRRKKYPELAQRCNDILPLTATSAAFDPRSKSEERVTAFSVAGASFRSKSAEPSRTEVVSQARLIITEYRDKFGWPPTMSRSAETDGGFVGRRKADPELMSASMPPSQARPTAATNKPATAKKPDVVRRQPLGRPHILFSREAAPIPMSAVKPKKTEYKAKFRPFSAYVYVSGNGWKKAKHVAPMEEGSESWLAEVAERSRKAVEFRSRSQFGQPINPGGLEEVYKNASDGLWTQPKVHYRDLAALELATTQMRIAEKKAERRHNSRSVSPVKSERSNTAPTVRSAPTAKAALTAKPVVENEKQVISSPGSGQRSPRPTSFSHVLPQGPVKTTEIKSPEEVTGVKSPSPESWTVEMEPGGPGLTWCNGHTADVPLQRNVIGNDAIPFASNGLISGPLSI